MSLGIDTNVLVRYLVQDDPEQSRRAAALIEEGCTPENPGVVSIVVLCELVWVLQRAYGCHRENVAEV
ncbi:MAG: PIN domain-containing protein, partial [Candidatus Dadabacteria bacterium]